MEAIDMNSKLDKGDTILIEPIDDAGHRFENFLKLRYGVLRDNYDNKNSFGVLSKLITIYKISYRIKIQEMPRVFCWYKEGFIMLKDFDDKYIETDNLFKLDNQEISDLNGLINKMKIITALDGNDRL